MTDRGGDSSKTAERLHGEFFHESVSKGCGGIVSFELDTAKVPLKRFFSKMTLFNLGESLGGVESLIEHPWLMSHSSMGEEALRNSGITQETVRVSTGVENVKDLIAELDAGLSG